jgi:magnesium chelatase subunit I
VFGDRGTGKSTAVRALAALLPKMRVVPAVRLQLRPGPRRAVRALPRPAARRKPHGAGAGGRPAARRDRGPRGRRARSGTRADPGEKAFEPGLLARAHRGFLYIDEVNLLEDHLVDLLLDVAASGENVVEREGLSVRHPARFVLIGSGNPEEGELRPQLLDRFGLSVEVKHAADLPTRVEVVRRRDEFERDPTAFVERWKRRTPVRRAGSKAREPLPEVERARRRCSSARRACAWRSAPTACAAS